MIMMIMLIMEVVVMMVVVVLNTNVQVANVTCCANRMAIYMNWPVKSRQRVKVNPTAASCILSLSLSLNV